MAYQVKQGDRDESNDPQGNPYASLAGDSGDSGAPSVATYSGQPPTPAGQGPASVGKTATGFVNFGDVYQANAGAAQQGTKGLQTSAQQQGQKAVNGRTGAEGQFENATRTGSVQAPTQGQQDWAKWGSTGVVQPKKVTGAQFNANDDKSHNGTTTQQQSVTEQNQGLNGGEQPLIGDGGVPVVAPSQSYDQSHASDEEAAVRAGAAGSYTGPNSLSDMQQYGQLAQDSAAAQDYATALASGNQGLEGMGMNATDAALLGAAGRPGFTRAGQQYGHLSSQLADANTQSQGIANSARSQSDADTAQYQGLLDEYGGRQSADQSQADAANSQSDAIVQNAHNRADQKGAYGDYLANKDQFRDTLHTIARATDATDDIDGGGTGLVAKSTNAISPQSATNEGNVWGGWHDDDADVWSSMSGSDWGAFNGMSDEQKRQWIEQRKKQLRGGS